MNEILIKYRNALYSDLVKRYGGYIRLEIVKSRFIEYRCQLDYSQASVISFIDNFLDEDKPTLQVKINPEIIFKEIESIILKERE